MIVRRNGKWYVVSEKGKNLGGPYDSEAAAKRQRSGSEEAIETG